MDECGCRIVPITGTGWTGEKTSFWPTHAKGPAIISRALVTKADRRRRFLWGFPARNETGNSRSSCSEAGAAEARPYKLAAKQTWIGEVEAVTEAEAIDKAAAEFSQYAAKLMAIRRS